jgi:hypothetical protein
MRNPDLWPTWVQLIIVGVGFIILALLPRLSRAAVRIWRALITRRGRRGDRR